MIYDDDTTCEEALRVWDSGDAVWSCSLGGLGPDYEQCIQVIGFEALRAMLADPLDYTAFNALDPAEKRKRWGAYVSKIDKNPGVKAVVGRLGPSGAQHGAAMNMASVFSRNGYGKGMAMVPEDRRIEVKRRDPRTPSTEGVRQLDMGNDP